MNCLLCKGELEDKLSTFMIEKNDTIIIIKNVPSQVCKQCGKISLKLEKILEKLEPFVSEFAIFEYEKVSA